MKSKEKELLLELSQAARRPGVKLYHFAVLSTLDEKGRPYSRVRSPTVILPYNMALNHRKMQISGKIPTRYSKERLEKAIELDTKYKHIRDKHEWELLCYDESVQDSSLKLSTTHFRRDSRANLLCLEAVVVIDPISKQMTVQRGRRDFVIDVEVTDISKKGEDLYDYMAAWYLLLLADTHLAAHEDKEKRFFDTVKEIWTAKYETIKINLQSEEGPIEILEDFSFANKTEGLNFIDRHHMGTLAIRNKDANRADVVSTTFDVDLSIAEGIFWQINSDLEFIERFFKKLESNLSSNDPFVSICTMAFGMKYELGIAVEGEITLNGEEITSYKSKNNISGSVAYIKPRRMTNISPSESRRKTVGVIFDEWK
ncbi:hypothetical protein CEE45_08125 [Candidatus Heimdallarchaeota archaeon B3_Heim]|nr:MAG: hypothetical protein CEE45_08125 [Candidatus Heimdallarchaeota archaeon B3_Heim]